MLRQQWERPGQADFRSLADYIAPLSSGLPEGRSCHKAQDSQHQSYSHRSHPSDKSVRILMQLRELASEYWRSQRKGGRTEGFAGLLQLADFIYWPIYENGFAVNRALRDRPKVPAIR
jgi:hypothetical protein